MNLSSASSAWSTALAGIHRAENQLVNAGQSGDPADMAVNLIQARVGIKANVKVIQALDDMAKTIIDMKV